MMGENVDTAPIIYCHHEKQYILRAQCFPCEECDEEQVTSIAEVERLCAEHNKECDGGFCAWAERRGA